MKSPLVFFVSMTWALLIGLASGASVAADPAAGPVISAADAQAAEILVQANSGPLTAIAGAWQLHGSADQAEARRVSIDEAVEPLAWMVRMFAAPILHQRTVPPASVEFFARDGEGWFQRVVDSGAERIQPVALGRGELEHVDPSGDPFRAIWDLDGDDTVQLRWAQSQAVGQNRYRLDPEADQLVLEQTIHVTEVKGIAPIVLISRFDRVVAADPPAVAAGGPGRSAASLTR